MKLEKEAQESRKLAEEKINELNLSREQHKITKEIYERQMKIAAKRFEIENERCNAYEESRAKRQGLFARIGAFIDNLFGSKL